jgi:hypothetical protein
MALPISCWVMRLVKPEIAAAWKANGREETPSAFRNFKFKSRTRNQ